MLSELMLLLYKKGHPIYGNRSVVCVLLWHPVL